jgi:O-antigen/teichoic acid export membrane protein
MKASHVAWSAAGLVAPLLVALVAIPPLLRTLGDERFGLLSLAWAVTAMAGLFDLGIGRVATRLVADHAGRGDAPMVAATLIASRRIAAWAGMGGALLFGGACWLGAYQALTFNPSLDQEVLMACLVLAACIPFQTQIATDRGVCEALQQFRGVSMVRALLSAATFLAPWLTAQFTTHIAWLVASLLATRVLAWVSFRALVRHAAPSVPVTLTPRLTVVEQQSLVRSGGWYTVSAVVGPLLVNSDRFVIGSSLTAAAVAAYTVPFDMVTQLLIGVSAVSSVAFPSITSLLAQNRDQAQQVFRRWLWLIMALMAMVCGIAAVLMPWALTAWLGASLRPVSIDVARLLCLGVWVNAVGVMYYAWLHAHGRFRDTALLHVAELLPYMALLMVAVDAHGVVGAAWAWIARVTVDTIAVGVMSHRGHRGLT